MSRVSLVFIALGAFFYVVVYTHWLKRRSPLNVVIGGFAGSCAALGGWSSVTSGLSLTGVLLATIVFLWTPAHFWSLAIALQHEYRRAAVPMLPVLLGSLARLPMGMLTDRFGGRFVFTALLAFYASAAELINDTYGHIVLPTHPHAHA